MRSALSSQNNSPTSSVAIATSARADAKPRAFEAPCVNQGGPRIRLMKSGMRLP
jgi:hypothetical protein